MGYVHSGKMDVWIDVCVSNYLTITTQIYLCVGIVQGSWRY